MIKLIIKGSKQEVCKIIERIVKENPNITVEGYVKKFKKESITLI